MKLQKHTRLEKPPARTQGVRDVTLALHDPATGGSSEPRETSRSRSSGDLQLLD